MVHDHYYSVTTLRPKNSDAKSVKSFVGNEFTRKHAARHKPRRVARRKVEEKYGFISETLVFESPKKAKEYIKKKGLKSSRGTHVHNWWF